MVLALFVSGPWMLRELIDFTRDLYTSIPGWSAERDAGAMQPLILDAADLSTWCAPVVAGAAHRRLRAGGAAHQRIQRAGPGQDRAVLALAFILAPLAPVPAGLSIFSGAGRVAAVQELLIGVAIGMVVQLAFEALTWPARRCR